MYCHLKSYSCTNSGARILPEVLWFLQYPSTTAKVCSVKKDTKLNQVFCIIKSWEIISISLPEFYLIIWLMRSPKNFEKIPILKTWQVDFFWGIKTYFGKMMLFQAWKNKYHIQNMSLLLTKLRFRHSKHLKMTFWISVLWKIFM